MDQLKEDQLKEDQLKEQQLKENANEWTDENNTFQYITGVQCSKNVFGSHDPKKSAQWIKRCPSNTTWEEARYLIEQKMNLHCDSKQKIEAERSYIVGWLWNDLIKNWRKDAEPLNDPKRQMKSSDRIIVARKPLTRRHHGMYVPQRFRATNDLKTEDITTNNSIITFSDDMTEEEKIKHLINIQTQRIVNHSSKQKISSISKSAIPSSSFTVHQHASDRLNNANKRVPPPEYICHRCGVVGHFKEDCPTLEDDTFIPLDQRRCPTGVPKIFMREAITEEERRTAWITEDGKYVMMKIQIQDMKTSVVPPQK